MPVGSTLIVRATGKLNLDVSGKGGVTPATETAQAPAGTQEYRFKIAATGAATLRGAGEDLTWAFNVIPDKPPTIALAKDPEQQARGSLLLSYRLEDDYGVTEARATFARKEDRGERRVRPHPLFGAARFRAGIAAGAHQERRRPNHQGSDRPSLGRRRSGDDACCPRRRRQRGQERAVRVPPAGARSSPSRWRARWSSSGAILRSTPARGRSSPPRSMR